ncbi:Cro/CI family transcriptional regulator [Psychromonas sp. Urea-02u-13]|uniref:Cro/CI family transcriptional regulator n=1 Tax=Psychromonas sp. Urea-02u-13 TaxID=2058326 RepID=UPI000C3437F2|nr:Cro/CI family transcriptional regulator [Psychromonas sp. Urea-02u-13]PKG37168.1 Cro/Cl family transcriptional regulator [Psychromonas sp. Urea-02u-13]
MKKADAIKYFKTVSKLAQAVGVTRMSVTQWGEEIPQRRAFEIERITNGELKADFTPVNQQSVQTHSVSQ